MTHPIYGADPMADLLSGVDDDFGAFGGSGTTELVGADDLHLLVGADAHHGNPNWRQMAHARQIDPRAVAVAQRQLNTRRKFPLGFPLQVIAAGGTAPVQTQPQFVFRPERLVIPSDIAFSLRVNDVKVGTTSQLASTDPIPASVFSEVAINTGVMFRTAEIGNLISFSAINITSQSVNFSAAIIGTSATTGT